MFINREDDTTTIMMDNVDAERLLKDLDAVSWMWGKSRVGVEIEVLSEMRAGLNGSMQAAVDNGEEIKCKT